MKWIFLPALLAASIVMPCVMQAGTLENWDLDGYRYETFGPLGARLQSGVIYAESDLYGICDAGCELRLVTTGQTIIMKPDDHVIKKYQDPLNYERAHSSIGSAVISFLLPH
jgi:hypothetical protein